MQIYGTQAKTGAIVNENSSLTVPTFAACVSILSSSMASLPLKLMRETAKGNEPARDHPLYDLVAVAPNATQTSYRWRSALMTCLCLGGNGYTKIIRDGAGVPTELQFLPPYKTQCRPIQGGNYNGMVTYRYNGETLMPWDVMHLRGLSTDGFFGISPIRAIRESLGLSLSMQEFTARTFNNGNRQPGVLKAPDSWDEAKAKEFMKAWQTLQAGAQNAGRTPLFYGGVEWKAAGWSNQDAELLLSRSFEKSEIASWFRIPMVLLGDTEKASSWGTGIEKITLGFVTYTLKPWVENWEQEMNFSLLTKEERKSGLHFKFDFKDLLRSTPTDQAAYLQKLWQVGAVSSNEVRKELDLIELPDATGDLYYVPANFVVAGKEPTDTQKEAAKLSASKKNNENE